MNLPKIDISALPDLDTLTGLFGSVFEPAKVSGTVDDTIIILMTFVFEILPPGSGHL